ncbi:MAG: Exosome complex component Rrp4 [Candidatus Methanolliviera sp. GoM_asphalt]|nr:MAG: Exosome complex component Rrp4 [Candidatus Methanolliviera sp. GoM_asphalt]
MREEVVIPGCFLGESVTAGEGTFVEENRVYSMVYGLVKRDKKEVEVIPLSGKYLPKAGDLVIGKVIESTFSMWIMDINSPYEGLLRLSNYPKRIEKEDMQKEMRVGEMVITRIKEVEFPMRINLAMDDRKCAVIREGVVIEITHTKIPRVIGKGGSMINLIKKKIGCNIFIGQNGRIWLSGSDEKIELAAETILKIEREAHANRLADRIDRFIRERKKGKGKNAK